MSIRRDVPSLSVVEAALRPCAAATGAPQTIGDRLGIERQPTPAKWPTPFKPQYTKPPVVVGSVVNDAFRGYGADPTGIFGKKKAASGAKVEAEPKKGSFTANMKAAKDKADAVVRKASAGAKAVAAGAKSAAVSAVDKAAGM